MTHITTTTGKKPLLFILPVVVVLAAVTLLLGAISGSAMGLATIERASVTSFGAQGNYYSEHPSLSPDGRWVAFQSFSTDLVSGDANGTFDAFLKDMDSGILERVSTTSAGVEGNSASTRPVVSTDGRFVAFESTSTNLVPPDTNGSRDIFVKDTGDENIQLISSSSAGAPATGSSSSPAITPSGRYIAFSSLAANLVDGDTNGQADIFIKDRETGATSRLNTGGDGVQSNGGAANPVLSADGRFVAFETSATNLRTGGDNNSAWDIYLKDSSTNQTELISVAFDGSLATGESRAPSISSDGRFVAFESDANTVVTPDTTGYTDIFVRDRQNGATVRVSTNAGGTPANGNSRAPSISSDGRYVAFSSVASNLAGTNSSFHSKIYVKDIQTGAIIRLSNNIAGALPDNHSYETDISDFGDYVAFHSDATNLITPGTDTNNYADVYRARVDNAPPLTTTLLWPDGITDGANGWFVSSRTLELRSNESGVTHYQWNSTLDAGWQQYFTPIPAPAGTHTIYFRSVDTANNTEDAKSLTVKTDPTNPNPPTSIVSDPLPNSASRNQTAEMSWSAASDSHSGIDGYSYSFTKNASEAPDTETDVDGSVLGATSPVLDDGRWYFHIRSQDKAGRWGLAAHRGPYIVDTTEPSVSFGSMAKPSGSFIRDAIPIPILVSDKLAGIERVSLMDESRLLSFKTSSPYTPYLYTRHLSNGPHTIGIQARDKAGNQKLVTRTYKVDNYRPRTEAPYAASVKRYSNVKLYYKIIDPYTPSAQVRIVITNSAGKIVKTVRPGWRGTGTLRYHSYYETLPRGVYYFYIGAIDKAGNTQYNMAKNRLVIR